MATQADVASNILAMLAITEPDLDTSVGSVTRKIIDAVAQQGADSYVDDHLLNYQYDIDSKIEADLDDFVQNFGMSRIAAKRATGVVIFQRGVGDTTTPIRIPVNTQIASTQVSTGGNTTLVQTVTPGFMAQGVSTVEVPVQAVEPGVAGNVGAGLLSRFRSPIEGILGVTNIQPLTGGTGQETDSELRARWKRTVFRSLAGTEPMYLGIALNDDACFGANVLGATRTYVEQIQIEAPASDALPWVKGVGTSSLTDVEFAYADTAVMGPHLAASQVLLRGHDFVLDTSVRPPKVTMLIDEYATGARLDDNSLETKSVIGEVFDLTYEYAPSDSRNKPSQGITNRVDVWCAGVRAASATQAVIFSSARRFVPDSGSPYFLYDFVREDHQPPLMNNIFIPLAFGPILTIPATLVIGSTTYVKGTDYWLVHDDTAEGYTATSRFGLEWKADRAPSGINPVFIVGEDEGDGGEQIIEGYTYNQMIEQIQGGIDRWRLTGIDARAHQAKLQYLRFNIAVMYDRTAGADITNGEIELALQRYLASLSFGATVQASDVIQAIHSAPGVDNVRFLDARDWPGYTAAAANSYGVGIQRVMRTTGLVVESYVDGPMGTVTDITFGDAEVPVYESFRGDRIDPSTGQPFSGVPAVRAQNTFWKGVSAPVTVSGGGDGGGSAFDITLAGTGTQQSGYVDLALTWTDPGPSTIGFTMFRDDEVILSFGPANGTAKTTSFSGAGLDGTHTFVIKGYTSFTTDTSTCVYTTVSNPLTVP